MLETFLKLLEKLTALVSERKRRQRDYFDFFIDPLYKDLRVVIDDYHSLFSKTRARLDEILKLEESWRQSKKEEEAAATVAAISSEAHKLYLRIFKLDNEYHEKNFRAPSAGRDPRRRDLLKERKVLREEREQILSNPKLKRAEKIVAKHDRRFARFQERNMELAKQALEELRGARETHARTRVQLSEMAAALERARPGREVLDFSRVIFQLFRGFDHDPQPSTFATELIDLFEFAVAGETPIVDLISFIDATTSCLDVYWRDLSRVYSEIRVAHLSP